MTSNPKFLATLLLAAMGAAPLAADADPPLVDHHIKVDIDPARGTLVASDRLTLPDQYRPVLFWLHKGLNPKVIAGSAALERIGREGHLERFRLTPNSEQSVTLSYGGPIRHGMQTVSEGMGRDRLQSAGTIAEDGVFLGGYTGWYPNIEGTLLRFDLAVDLPTDWLAVSQGAGPEPENTDSGVRVRWREQHPQDQIQLSAARFKLYRRQTAYGEAQAYLRRPDDALAARYLDATADYLERYSRLIGDYPYAKFALVENFWETGYGMPSFTLLGSRVLRLPFILHSSYPHEILHNWWGNGVYVDYAAGNWSEGLTAYLADHLNQEIAGRGADYRRDQLKAYADYVLDGDDFPLVAFSGRHGAASQAIGYGKTMMTLHMLRVMLGDDDFRQGLRRFYADNRFRTAGFDDLRRAFELISGRDLRLFFDAWTGRTGAAELELGDIDVEPQPGGGYGVTGSLYQAQEHDPFPMVAPVIIHDVRGRPWETLAEFNGREARFEFELPAAPARVAIDPRFETFRRLLPAESPVTLSNLFGADVGLIVLPANAPGTLHDGYSALAKAWQKGHARWRIGSDDDMVALPKDVPVWLLGWENRFLPELTASGAGFTVDPDEQSVRLDGENYASVSIVLTARRGEQPLGLVAAAEPGALPGLARKLPHYGKYGYLLFSGVAPDNRKKGQWPAAHSSLMHWFTDERPVLQLPVNPPLVSD
ncbi:MAG: M1 family aminopeptidase [Thiohalocapsa sp.]